MSIIIHGLDMPKRKNDVLLVKIFPNGGINWWNALGVGEIARTQKRRAEQLPPHGRLIDADALRQDLKDSIDECNNWADEVEPNTTMYARISQALGTFVECSLRVKAAPTIIEAEVEEK